MNNLQWLQKFYLSNCNGDWEHGYGIKIDTLDNPGWAVYIHLEDTKLENLQFDSVNIERNEDNWIVCKVENNIFSSFGGPENLDEILDIFRKWVGSFNKK